MFSEQWKSSLFAGIAFVLVGICYVAIAQSAPVLSIQLSRKYTSHSIEWPKSDCRVSALRFTAADASLHLHTVRITFVGGGLTQSLTRLGPLLFRGTTTEWFRMEGGPRDGSIPCIDKIEVYGRSVGTSWPDAKVQVEVK
jgi:hypothetical protein